MLIVNSAWPFATVRGPGFTGRVCTRAHVAKFFYPCSLRVTMRVVAVRVSLTSTRVQPQGGSWRGGP